MEAYASNLLCNATSSTHVEEAATAAASDATTVTHEEAAVETGNQNVVLQQPLLLTPWWQNSHTMDVVFKFDWDNFPDNFRKSDHFLCNFPCFFSEPMIKSPGNFRLFVFRT